MKAVIVDLKRNALHANDELKRCEKIACPKTRSACDERVRKDARTDEHSLHKRLVEEVSQFWSILLITYIF